MGFFSNRKKPVISTTTFVPLPPLPPPAAAIYTPPPLWSPPRLTNNYNPQESADFALATQLGASAYDVDPAFMSVDDSDAIQQARGQDSVLDQFDTIITNIDADRWSENDESSYLVIEEEVTPYAPVETARALVPSANYQQARRLPRTKKQKVTIYSKVSLYSNSRIAGELPPLRLYINTWPLICLAAQYSRNVYLSPQNRNEKSVFVSADARLGTKAMVMKSVPCDDKKTLVFAIRGTTLSIRDWCVNLDTTLVSPTGFLDDDGNLCHSGFLRVAKNMIRPIAMRLRTLLEENPNRVQCSLLITGHSAGGAIAALIFTHMLSSIKSELSNLVSCFKRVHCIVFGAPPVSLLPLTKPTGHKYQKYQFMSFINEGDPVVRAEKAYMRSLVDLLSSPPPTNIRPNRNLLASKTSYARLQQSISRLDLTLSKLDLRTPQSQPTGSNAINNTNAYPTGTRPTNSRVVFASSTNNPGSPIWPIPTSTLSNAGRLVILRAPPQPSRKTSDSNRWEKDNLIKVTAHKVSDDQLRGVVFGDPSMHAMEVYLRRVDMLALKAVTARA